MPLPRISKLEISISILKCERKRRSVNHERHFALLSKVRPNEVMFRQPLNPSLDGNTVEMAVEQMEFSENVVRYQTTLQFLTNKISGLMSAIKGE